MQIDSIRQPIATRKFFVEGQPAMKVIVTMGKPERDEESIGYFCPFEISGPTSDRLKYAKGVDAFHAIQGALTLIALDLEFLNENLERKMRWEGDDSGGLGFPIGNQSGLGSESSKV